MPDGYSFWTAVRSRGFTVGGVYGEQSNNSGGITVLHNDRGKKQPPGFAGGSPPGKDDVMPETEE